jgi:hypothetical protein
MTTAIDGSLDPQKPARLDGVAMPQSTAWPIVLALGITLLGAGLASSLALSVVGGFLFVFGVATGTTHWSHRSYARSPLPKGRALSTSSDPAWRAIGFGFRRRFIRFPQASRGASLAAL